ncbi:hypothetical protein H8A95_00235 [Bradyrhizobium sp. Pear76]|uniref:hypothetical protein n=1 Tax=Bradyrhizobium oropedii TaxID=1571201 RepID=UPI001E4283B2|nr:hypothetical protein [Bradyrhizobium oropedii]MCC8960775.1 hypothetical protein [Bradyrhizobium oropedii]
MDDATASVRPDAPALKLHVILDNDVIDGLLSVLSDKFDTAAKSGICGELRQLIYALNSSARSSDMNDAAGTARIPEASAEA